MSSRTASTSSIKRAISPVVSLPSSRKPSTPTPTPAQPSSSQPSSTPDLSQLIGTYLHITLSDTNEHQGYLYCFDLGCLVLERPSSSSGDAAKADDWAPGSQPISSSAATKGKLSDFTILKTSNIKSISVIPPPSASSSPAYSSVDGIGGGAKRVDVKHVAAREQSALKKEDEKWSRMPPKGVSKLGGELSHALGKSESISVSQLSCVLNDGYLI